MSTKPVLIIGGGLGGLALARTLLRNNVPFRIFERDADHDSRTQGWAISLHQWMIDDFKSTFDENVESLRALSPTASIDAPSEGVIYSLEGGERKELTRLGEGTPRSFIRVQRAKLRDWLMRDIKVEWNKRFTRYEQTADGVMAYFEDGSSVEGSILVGADGVSSSVRRQLLPEAHHPERVALGIVIGEVEADKETYQRWLKLGNSFSVGFADTRRLFVGTKVISDDQSKGTFYWMFGWADEKAVDPGYWTSTASQQELHDYVMSHLDNLEPQFIEPYRATKPSGISMPPLQLRDMEPPPIPTGKVTLLGDAVHPMVPFRGEGGNMAMEDGLVLGKQIAQQQGQTSLEAVLKAYEAEMTKRAGASVVKSREATFEYNNMVKG